MKKVGLMLASILAWQCTAIEASEFSQVNVKGWAKHCDLACQTSLTVYNEDGEELDGTQDLSKETITGKKDINDYELVQLVEGVWVENDVINIDYCDQKAAVFADATINRGSTSAMGSGEGC